jgi:hypothetical protein
MCATDPTTLLSARILDAGGALLKTLNGPLIPGTDDYTLAWSTTGPDACKIILTLTDNAGAIAPNQRLEVTYQTQIDPAFVGGGSGNLINVAGATHWFNANSTVGSRKEFLGGGTGLLTGSRFRLLLREDSQQSDDGRRSGHLGDAGRHAALPDPSVQRQPDHQQYQHR